MKEYRKLISFGKNSFVISLPKSWITQNKLLKGDLIHIADDGHNLILSKQDLDQEGLEKRKVIPIDGKSLDVIEREINSCYILNYRTIVLKGEEVRNNIKNLQSLFQNLIALEVMEQTPTSLVAKDFLNMDKVSVEEITRKMDIVTRAMFNECSDEFTEENYKSVNDRDCDVNRLYYLLYRSALYNIDNPLKALKNFNLSSIDFVNYLFTAHYLEGIADEVRRTARYGYQLELPTDQKEKFQNFMKSIREFYLATMKVFYNKKVNNAFELAPRKSELNKELDQIEKEIGDVKHMGKASARMRRLISYIHNIGRQVYQGYNYSLTDELNLK
jgi:phosphate uptake regulator